MDIRHTSGLILILSLLSACAGEGGINEGEAPDNIPVNAITGEVTAHAP